MQYGGGGGRGGCGGIAGGIGREAMQFQGEGGYGEYRTGSNAA